MPAILTDNISLTNTVNFINDVISNNYFIGIGKSTQWTDDNIPDQLNNTISEQTDFRENFIALKHLYPNSVALVVPRVNWEAGFEFKTLDVNIPNAHRAENYYCMNSENLVFQCIGVPYVGATSQAGSEPKTKSQSFQTPDGFTWKYLYTVPAEMISSYLLLDGWLPIAYNENGVYPGGTLTEDQYLYGDVNANITLGATDLLMVCEVTDNTGTIPENISYRQVSLIKNPTDSDGAILGGDVYLPSDFNINSGVLIYLENRRPIYREPDQTEKLQIIMDF